MEHKINNLARNRVDDRVLFFIMPLMFTVIVLAIWGLGYHHIQPGSGMASFLGILTALTYIGMIVIFGLYLAEEKDEFERTVLSQSMLWGIGATLTVTTSWGVLELYDKVRHLNPLWVFFLFCFFMSTARLLLKLRYR